jgi:predicted RNA-binding protein YlxR (DUF448 family)
MRDGRLDTDPSAGGRGAWVCPNTECFQLAIKRRAFPRALKTEVPSEALEALRAAFVTGAAFPRDARS